jgi:hypothetical protein
VRLFASPDLRHFKGHRVVVCHGRINFTGLDSGRLGISPSEALAVLSLAQPLNSEWGFRRANHMIRPTSTPSPPRSTEA